MGERSLAGAQAPENDGKEQDKSHDHLLRVRLDSHQAEEVADKPDNDDADDRFHHTTVAAGELVPPMTTAAIASSSHPGAARGSPTLSRPAMQIPAKAAKNPEML